MQTEYICLYSHVHGLACMRISEDLLQKQAFLFHNGGLRTTFKAFRLGRIHPYSVSHLGGMVLRV